MDRLCSRGTTSVDTPFSRDWDVHYYYVVQMNNACSHMCRIGGYHLAGISMYLNHY